uniref:Reverse transcriptase N-terminal domain-containing protein n=1 Tax=Neodangemannia microcystis TaxID=173495 RepID=A0A1W6EHH4_9CHLO|nr:hypothetical protein [Neodangemannia microcystis]ARK14816.1 hypothetical protein [Neodangemannia microcystis]
MCDNRLSSSEEQWKHLNWKVLNFNVSKIQKKIYIASKMQKKREVASLQKFLVRSWSARVVAVRRVSQDNRGKVTPGVDDIFSLTCKQRLELARCLSIDGKANKIRRIYIPRPDG